MSQRITVKRREQKISLSVSHAKNCREAKKEYRTHTKKTRNSLKHPMKGGRRRDSKLSRVKSDSAESGNNRNNVILVSPAKTLFLFIFAVFTVRTHT